jgi:hypothetical protein
MDTAGTGRELILQALTAPDYELILVDTGLDLPPVDLLIQQLRRDFRSGSVPIGIMARVGQLARARQLAGQDPLADAFPRIYADEVVRDEVQRLLKLLGRRAVGAAERQRQAVWAIDRLVELSHAEPRIFDLGRLEATLRGALDTPSLTAQAAEILGTLGTPASQQALVELASRPAQPVEMRKRAAAALQESVRRRGVLLTSSQILRQYDRYNQSRRQDRATQEVLGWLLDIIEAPSRESREAAEAMPGQRKSQTEAKKG